MKEQLKTFFSSRTFWETALVILFAVVLFVGLRVSIQSYIVYGPSMENNYHQDEWIIVNKLDYKFHDPQRGDIIVFQPPVASSKPYIKRIIGLPGERVVIKNGVTYVTGTDGAVIRLDEPYIKSAAEFTSNYDSGVIPPNDYFVMGDNRANSTDSRYGWFASRDKIIGEAWISIWPPHLWGTAPYFRQPASATITPATK